MSKLQKSFSTHPRVELASQGGVELLDASPEATTHHLHEIELDADLEAVTLSLMEESSLNIPDLTPYALSSPIQSARYVDRGLIGRGGMGEVYRVFDRSLGREIAMKVMHQHLCDDESLRQAFHREAQILSQLQHPHILPIYDYGALESERPYFTMLEVRGETLNDYIKSVHTESGPRGWQSTSDGWSLNRLISALCDVAKAVSYAHERGVIHQDLKPDNVVIGEMGETLVVDWGLAHIEGSDQVKDRSLVVSQEPKQGFVLTGTLPYLAPEMAQLSLTPPTKRSDIYALGVILYEVLNGSRPKLSGSLDHKLRQIRAGDLFTFSRSSSSLNTDVDERENLHMSEVSDSSGSSLSAQTFSLSGAPLPSELVSLCRSAVSVSPEQRPESARHFARALQRWLDGSLSRDKALLLVREADALSEEIERHQAHLSDLSLRVDQASQTVSPWASSSEKSALWTLEDELHRVQDEVARLSFKRERLYHAALLQKTDLNEAHLALAQLYLEEHERAERSGDQREAWRLEQRLREHLEFISARSERAPLEDYLAGYAHINLTTAPQASISIAPFETRDRRLVLGAWRVIGEGTLRDYPLPLGSHLVRITLSGHHTALYPIYNRRRDHITGLDPDGVPYELKLLPQGSLAPDDCYVPGGWGIFGGDPHTPNSVPEGRAWIDSFVIKRFPVTHEGYINFLNSLVARGELDEALRLAPYGDSAEIAEGDRGAHSVYTLEEGCFTIPQDADEVKLSLHHPVTQITWSAARSYARWFSEQTGQAWRLPMELEWEKAARGVDGRSYPWGDYHDPSWSCMKDSHQGEVHMYPVGSFPADESVYGVVDTAGNTRDWCLDRFRESGPPLHNGRLLMPSDEDLEDVGFKSTRGGSYGNSNTRARSADRDWWFPERRYIGRGLRLARSV